MHAKKIQNSCQDVQANYSLAIISRRITHQLLRLHTRRSDVDLLHSSVGSRMTFKKYTTFFMLIYSYINMSGNWKNEKLCGNTTPAGRSVFTQFRVFPIFTSVDITVYQHGKNVLYFFYNIAQRTLTEEWWEIFHVDIELLSTRLLANQRSEFTNGKQW